MINRQWLLTSRPTGMVSPSNFTLNQEEIRELKPGEALVKTIMLSFEPAMRGWMDDQPSYLPPAELNRPMRAPGVGRVIASENPALPVGTLVQGMLNWQEYLIDTPDNPFPLSALPEGTPPNVALSVLGGTSLTGYFGLLRIGEPKAGDTVVVSGAAGATGSVVAQIAKMKNCRVIGIAGGKTKCGWLRDDLKLDAVIDYKAEPVDTALARLCPEGIDLFFDNVGGETLQAALQNAADYARFVLCGSISNYNDATPTPGPNNMFNIISRRIKMQGFIMFDFLHDIDTAMADLVQWLSEGKLQWKEDIQHGFDNIPNTFLRLFDGSNDGKQLLALAEEN